MPKLTRAEIEGFLEEPGHIMRLGTIDEDGSPRVVPIWYWFEGGEILFTPRAESVWRQNLLRDPRVGLSIDEGDLPYRKVTVQGPARLVHDLGDDDAWRDGYRAMAIGYIGEEGGNAYVDDTDDQPRALYGIALDAADTKLSSWRMPVEDEDVSGVWARRYYLDETQVAERIKAGEHRRMYGT